MEYDNERISQAGNCKRESISCLLDKASDVAARVLKSVQEIAGTTYCKGVQIKRLREFAISNNYWFSSIPETWTFSDRGSENEVYLSEDRRYVYKLNDFRYSDDNLSSFFERLRAHNELFPQCQYKLIGFAENSDGKTCAVLSQPFIQAEREATNEEIKTILIRMGFEPCFDGEYFSNGVYDIFDALPNNVLYGIDGNFYFIDTIIYKTNTSNIGTYKSLSPRFSS